MSDKPLNGIKVLELGLHVTAPSCAEILRQFGAEVIKIEQKKGEIHGVVPLPGQPKRRWKTARFLISITWESEVSSSIIKTLPVWKCCRSSYLKATSS